MSGDPHTPEGFRAEDEKQHSTEGHPSLDLAPKNKPNTDLFNLSANFSTESLTLNPEDSPVTPSMAHTPYNNFSTFKRYHGGDSNPSLVNSPMLNIPTPYTNPRGSFNSNTSRTRPKSMFLADGINETIIEGNVQAFDPDLARLPPMDAFNSNRLSTNFGTLMPPPAPEQRYSRSRSGSPVRARSPVRGSTSPQRRTGSPTKLYAFNFKLQELGERHLSPALALKPAQRKGHRYKHSSVSMNLFQEPIPIAESNHQPDLIPDLFLLPNFWELLSSTTSPQKLKLMLAIAHAFTAAVVFIVGSHLSLPSFSTLAHLVFYDSLGSIIIACVDIMSNFEIWSELSIAYPFGLGRLEVLAGFALSTSLIMVGCDLISHFVEELALEIVHPSSMDSSDHGSHHIHGSASSPTNWFLYECVLASVCLITWLSSLCIVDQNAITTLLEDTERKTRKPQPLNPEEVLGLSQDSLVSSSLISGCKSKLKSFQKIVAKNPIRILTLAYSMFLAAVPIIPTSIKSHIDFDLEEVSTFAVAAVLCYVGWKIALTLGGILLISFPYSDYDYDVLKASIYDKVLGLPSFKPSFGIHKIFLAKANHRLYIVGIEVSIKGGSSDDESRLTFDINRIITDAVKEFDDESQVETTVTVTK